MGDQAAEEVAGRRAHDTAHAARRDRARGGRHFVAETGDRGRDAGLAAGLAAGRDEALAELYDRYAPLAYGVAIRILGDPGRAEDAVQDAFLNVWSRASTFDPERGSLRAWLLATVRNRCIDVLRGRAGREMRERELEPEAAYALSPSDPWREVALSLERTAVRDAMASLPTAQRQVIELAYFGGYSQAEISGMTRLPLGTVKGRMRLGLEKIGSFLRGRGLVDV